jgi:hypothetical protein
MNSLYYDVYELATELHPEAEKKALQYIELAQSFPQKEYLGYGYENLGIVFSVQNYFDSAVYYHNKALNLF